MVASLQRAQDALDTSLNTKQELAEQRENELLMLRGGIEVLWVELGAVAHDIISNKLWKYRKDAQGNYFRTARAYFQHLDEVFKERGWQLSRTTLYRFADDYHLFVTQLGMTPQQCQLLGKTTLETLAPAVRKLLTEGDEGREQAADLVQEVMAAIEANEGLPRALVNDAIDDATGRVMKSVEVSFAPTPFAWKLAKLTLWWGERPINLLGEQLSDEQVEWLARRLGNPSPLPDTSLR